MSECGFTLTALIAASTGSTFAQLCAGWIAVLPIAALAIYGWFNGLFLAIVAGMQILVSFVLALACGRPLAASMEGFGVPPDQALVAAYLLVFVGSLVVIRLAVGAWVPDGAVSFTPVIDRVGGSCAGGVAGALLGGALLVGWSLAALPAWLRFDDTHLPFDGGRRLLWTFARCAASDVASAQRLLQGDQPVTGADAPGSLRGSEPFVDDNGNGIRDGGGGDPPAPVERYLDLDGNGAFTPTLRFVDADGDGRRAIGLADCYRLAEWRRVRCMHAPIITSGEAAEIQEDHAAEEPIYRATATDADGGDAVTFRLKLAAGEDVLDVAIDPATGEVTLLEPADFETKKRHVFVVEARDRAGLTAEKQVMIRVRDIPLH